MHATLQYPIEEIIMGLLKHYNHFPLLTILMFPIYLPTFLLTYLLNVLNTRHNHDDCDLLANCA